MLEVQASGAHASAPGIGRSAACFIGATIALGVGVCAYAAWEITTQPFSPGWLVLLLLTVLAGYATLRVPTMPISFSISDTFAIVAALVVGPAAGALTAALDGLVLSFRMANDRRAPHRILFNMACLALATFTAGKMFFALAGPQPLVEGPGGALRLVALLAVFGAVHFGVNSGVVAVAIGFERRTSVLAIWREHFSGLWVSSLGGVFAAMLMMVLSRNSTLEILIVIAPLPVILYVTLRHALGRAEDQITHLGKMNTVYVATIEALAQAVDAKDQVTHEHIRRVQRNALGLAATLGVRDTAELQALEAASLLHDIGKIAIPEHILNKPGKLTTSEFEIMKGHAAIGADILAVIGFPYPLVPIVRHHHENWDGTGYPDGIRGEQIPIGARILQVVDCFDALTSDRPYRPALDPAAALQIVAERRGTMYDPEVVDALVAMHARAGTSVAAADLTGGTSVVPRMPAPERPHEPARQRPPLAAFYDLGRALGAPLPAARAGAALWAHLRAHVPASSFVLFVYEPASDALIPAYRAGEPTIDATTRIPLGGRLSGWVGATRQAIVNSDARLDLDAELRDHTLLRSALAVPVTSDGQTLGVLAFYAHAIDAFDATHRELAEAAAYVASTALDTAAPQIAAVGA